MSETRPRAGRRLTAALALSGLAGALVIAGTTLAAYGAGTDGFLLATRYTARFSFFLFLAVYLISPTAKVSTARTMKSFLRERRGFGLGFAAAHFVHLAALTSYFLVSDETPNLLTAIFGGIAYVLIAAMASTSNDWSVRKLGPRNWGRLHRAGLHYVWFIFVITLLGRVAAPSADPDPAIHLLMFSLAIAAFLFRTAVYWIFRLRAAPRTA